MDGGRKGGIRGWRSPHSPPSLGHKLKHPINPQAASSGAFLGLPHPCSPYPETPPSHPWGPPHPLCGDPGRVLEPGAHPEGGHSGWSGGGGGACSRVGLPGPSLPAEREQRRLHLSPASVCGAERLREYGYPEEREHLDRSRWMLPCYGSWLVGSCPLFPLFARLRGALLPHPTPGSGWESRSGSILSWCR